MNFRSKKDKHCAAAPAVQCLWQKRNVDGL